MNILLLCNYDPYNAAMVTDHINSIYSFSKHNVFVYSQMVSNGGNIDDELDLDRFDAIIVHYSIFLSVDAYISQKSRFKLKKFKGIKAVFIQDEYRTIEKTIASLQLIEADILFTCVPEKHFEDVYPMSLLPNLKKVQVLTGYINEDLTMYPPLELRKRKYDVSYRGRKYPAWHGRLGREKWVIGERFKKDARKYKIKSSISSKENDRLYGAEWINLIRNSKAVLGVESGASVFDFTGEISARVETYTSLTGVIKKEYDESRYLEIRDKFFKEIEDQYDLSQISPRVLEAISLRTACILYKGDYSGILIPWRHYIPLEKDHSNIAEVMSCLKDNDFLAELISNAYAEVALNPKYSYKFFVEQFDEIIDEHYKLNKKLINQEKSTVELRIPETYLALKETGATLEKSIINLEKEKKNILDEQEFYKKYYFPYIRNPHSITISKKYLFLRRIWSWIPYKIKVKVRNFLRK